MDFEFDESKFHEDDEQMLVVRGANKATQRHTNIKSTLKKPIVKEFSLCDYYLVRGTAKAFKVYPFVRKRGKATGAVGNCVFEYDEKRKPVILGEDYKNNCELVYNDIKLQSLLSFVATLANINVDDLLNITKHGKSEMTTFDY